MKALVVTAHPQRNSFTQALAGRFCAGLAAGGHEAELADLYDENFNPTVSPEEMDSWEGGAVSPEIVAQQQRLKESQGLVLAYPVWWSTPPAILTGWMQRVFTRGFAFRHVGGRTEGLLRMRAQLLVNVGSRQRDDVDLPTLYLEPLLGVLSYCGMEVLPAQANWGVYPQAPREALQAHLDLAYENGARFFS